MFLYSSWIKRLIWLPTKEDIQMSLPVICKFISWVDGNKSVSTCLDELRLQLFKISSNNKFRELPPSGEGLEIHIRRSSYQSGWIWGNLTSQEQVPPVENFWLDCTRGKPVYTLVKIVGTINFRETHY